MRIHKFSINGLNILLDVNSGAVHIIDSLTNDIMDIFDGNNDDQVVDGLQTKYDPQDVREVMTELHELIEQGLLFAPDIEVPLTFKQQPIVKSLCLHVAHDCNLRCRYCFAGTGDFGHSRGLMSKEVGEKGIEFIIEKSGPRKHLDIDFFGGEPLVNMDTVKHLVQYARRREQETGKNIKLTLTTNGVLLNKENEQFLNDNRVLLVLSLDGRREVHDRMRPFAGGCGSYDTVVNNFRRVIASRQDKNYFLRGTFTAYNLDFSEDVLDMAAIGTQLSVEPVVADEGDYALKEEHLPIVFAQYEKLALEYLQRKLNGQGFEFFHFNVDLNNGPCVAKRLSGCGAGHEYFAVTPDGDLYPCHQFVGREEYLIGNVDQGITNEALSQHFRQAHVLNKPACRQCWARYFCSGGCHANADLFNHSILEPYTLGCELQKKRLECAIMVQAVLLQHNNGRTEKIFNNFDFIE